jgi:hypothetical protein
MPAQLTVSPEPRSIVRVGETCWALAIFTGAFLLFQVQPLIGKYILPWFGGGPGVWTTCMLFFQVLLLGGYAYAHFLSRSFKPRAQAIIHLVLLAVALALLPITPNDSWKPRGESNPMLQILALLTASVGLPYFVLSATGPLMQQWFSHAHPGKSPYRLYALSNVGSLLALVSYPFYFETHFTRKAQAAFWGCGLIAYAIFCVWCAAKLWRIRRSEGSLAGDVTSADASAVPTFAQKLLWLLLPACASVLLLATTNKLCQDVAVIPFLWVLPLGLYLLSFIICFDNPRWYVRAPFVVALIAATAGTYWALTKGPDASIQKQVVVWSGALFVCCLICHGELYRLRPDPRYLTAFYLMIALGGAVGGAFVAIVSPLLFTDYYELHWGLAVCWVLLTFVCWRDPDAISNSHWRWLACALVLVAFVALDRSIVWLAGEYSTLKGYSTFSRISLWLVLAIVLVSWIAQKKFKTFPRWRLLACAWLSLATVGAAVALGMTCKSDGDVIHRSRNFYGVLTVYEHNKDDPDEHHFLLLHGRITHGLQFAEPPQSRWPTTYYSDDSGISLAMRALPAGNRRIGVVGLGTGTTAAFGQSGDYLRIYEINPEIKRLASSPFTYLSRCTGTVEVVMGDARLSMEREPSQQFDLLALDAFSSDAIPVHLLTKEAFALYDRHMKTNGVILVHISNHYLNLEPVVVNIAREFNYQIAIIDAGEDEEQDWWVYASTWILLSRNRELINGAAIQQAKIPINSKSPKIPLWTDDFASLFQILQ